MPIIITKKLIALPKRRRFSHKGDNGRVLVVGGSPEYIGAPALSAIAAMRSGADSVIVVAPERVAWAINCLSADIVTKKLKGTRLSSTHYPSIAKILTKADVLLIGPGMADDPSSRALIKKTVKAWRGLKVLDALALTAFDPAALSHSILLPNHAEFEKLKQSCRIKALLLRGNIVIQKSAQAKILTKAGIFENRTGNAGLTKAGTGDVLAGLVTGFLAQSKDMLQSAINAVYMVGVCADVLYKKKKGYFYLASDLAEEIGHIL